MRPLETSEDRLALLKMSGASITATIAGAEVVALFRRATAEELGIEGTQASLTCRSKDVSGVPSGAATSVPDEGDFTVHQVLDGGGGFSWVILKEA